MASALATKLQQKIYDVSLAQNNPTSIFLSATALAFHAVSPIFKPSQCQFSRNLQWFDLYEINNSGQLSFKSAL